MYKSICRLKNKYDSRIEISARKGSKHYWINNLGLTANSDFSHNVFKLSPSLVKIQGQFCKGLTLAKHSFVLLTQVKEEF